MKRKKKFRLAQRLVLIDQQACFRGLLRFYLGETYPECDVAGEGSLAKEASALCRKHQPDLLVLHHPLPDGSGSEVIARLVREHPKLRIVLSAARAGVGLAQALEAGAHGYALKDAPLEQLREALEAVADGGTFDPSEVATQAHEEHLLTERQLQLLALIVSGLSTRRIATRLRISYKTADHHRSRLMKALGVHDLASLVRTAIARGLVEA